MDMREHTAQCYKNVRKILKQGLSEPELIDKPPYDADKAFNVIILAWCLLIAGFLMIPSCRVAPAKTTEPIHLKASWYSVASLKKEGTYKNSKGVMANGYIFNDSGLTCATRLFPLGVVLRVTDSISKRFVDVKVTDRIGKRFGHTRIDLSKSAFKKIARLEDGLINVAVERIN